MKSLLSEISEDLARVTPAQIEHALSLLTKPEPGEKLIVAIEDHEARALWALALDYERQQKLAVHSARYDTASIPERDILVDRGARFSRLTSIVRDMAWLRMQDITRKLVGFHAVIETDTFGLRENFSLVSTTSVEVDAVMKLQKMFSGKAMLLEILRSSIETSADENDEDKDEEDPKSKVQ